MIAIDTNVLVRLLVDEPGQPAQVVAARKLASDAHRVHVPLVVLVELVWVLESCYQVTKQQVVDALRHLLDNDAFQLESTDRCAKALNLFAGGSAGFSDCVILAGCAEAELPLHTFDKRLARIDGAHLVKSVSI